MSEPRAAVRDFYDEYYAILDNVLVRKPDRWRLRERIVVFDSDMISDSLV